MFKLGEHVIGENKRKLKTSVKEHREGVDKLMEGRAFIRGTRKESETDQWKSPIMDHAIEEKTCYQLAKFEDSGVRCPLGEGSIR